VCKEDAGTMSIKTIETTKLLFTVLLLFLDSACISRMVPFCNILPNVELLSVRASRVLLSDLASLCPAVLHFDDNGIFNEVSSLLLTW
jgi:hypothetical protein